MIAAPAPPPEDGSASPGPAPIGAVGWILLVVVLTVGAAARVRLLDLPLERDEGEYAYAGQLLLDGVPPYAALYNMKLPGIYVIYAGVMRVFGETATGIHTGLLVASVLNALLVFLIARRIFHGIAGSLAACLVFGLLSVGLGVQGPFANAEHFVLPFALGGLLMALRAGARDRLLDAVIAGLLLGAGFVVKQQGGLFVVAGAVVLGMELRRGGAAPRAWRRVVAALGVLIVSAAVPYGLTCAWLASEGVFDRFWFLTWTYASAYAGQVPLSEAGGVLRESLAEVVVGAEALWGLAVAGVLVAARALWRGEPAGRVLCVLATGSIVATSVGLYFRPHYFVLLLPVLALLTGLSIDALWRAVRRRASGRAAALAVVGVVLALTGVTAWRQRPLLTLSGHELVRQAYGANPFIESLEVAAILRDRMKPDARVAVLGSEPQIAFYADRRSATGYVYMYPLMEAQPYAAQMQREMIAEIEASAPTHLVLVACETTWLRRPESVTLLFDWVDALLPRYRVYRVVDLPELAAHPEGAPADEPFPGLGLQWIAVYERR